MIRVSKKRWKSIAKSEHTLQFICSFTFQTQDSWTVFCASDGQRLLAPWQHGHCERVWPVIQFPKENECIMNDHQMGLHLSFHHTLAPSPDR